MEAVVTLVELDSVLVPRTTELLELDLVLVLDSVLVLRTTDLLVLDLELAVLVARLDSVLAVLAAVEELAVLVVVEVLVVLAVLAAVEVRDRPLLASALAAVHLEPSRSRSR